MSSKRVRLWSDEPSPVDLRAFGAVAETAVEPVLDDAFDPIALGSRLAKRVLDDLNVRSAIAESRGIELDIWMVTKLMVLELLLSEECDMVLRWLAHGEPRRQLASFKFKGIAGPGDVDAHGWWVGSGGDSVVETGHRGTDPTGNFRGGCIVSASPRYHPRNLLKVH